MKKDFHKENAAICEDTAGYHCPGAVYVEGGMEVKPANATLAKAALADLTIPDPEQDIVDVLKKDEKAGQSEKSAAGHERGV